jgi:dTMP kinase
MGRSAAETRFESKGAAFHARLREGFRAVAEANPLRCRLIDASGEPDAVAERVWAAVEPML